MSPLGAGLRPKQKNDDDSILEAALMVVTSDWYYDFEDNDNKTQWGIGTTGAMEYARIRAELGRPIRFTAAGVHVCEVVRQNERGIEATVVSRDAITGAEGIGHAYYPNYKKGKGPDRLRDEFNDRVAVSVAKRNAILDLIPEAHIMTLLRVRTTVARDNDRTLRERIKAARNANRENTEAAGKIEVTGKRSAPPMRSLGADPYDENEEPR